MKELTTSESEQNNAIESEDYELAETFNATIADVQNRQSRNASELRTVASEVENLRSEQLELFQNHLNNIGKYSKRRRSNVVNVIVIFIRRFLF